MVFVGSSVALIGLGAGIALWTDIKQHRIPNMLSLCLMVSGIALQAIHLGWGGLLNALAGIGIALLFFLPAHFGWGMGAGDVKLVAAIAALLSPVQAAVTAIAIYGLGSLISLGVLAWKGGMGSFLRRYWKMLKRLITTGIFTYESADADDPSRTRFPYAVAISAGTAAGFLWQYGL